MVVGDEGSFVGCSDEPVVPDAGGEGEESSGDSGVDAVDGASAVVFEGELAFHRVEHRFNPLANTAELPEARFFVIPVGSDQFGFEFSGDEVLELFPGEAFVADDDLAGSDQMFVVAEHRFGCFAFPNFRVSKSPDDRHSVGCADQVEAKSPEVSGVGGAVAVAGVACEVGAFHRFAGLAARYRGRVDQPGDLTPGGCVVCQFGDYC